MYDTTINKKLNHNNHTVQQPNANFRLRPPVKQILGDVIKATEEQQKQNDMVSEYNQMCGDNQINLLKQQNQNDSKISNILSESLGKITSSMQDMNNTLRGVNQQIKQRTDSSFTQKQQQQQQEQQKQQQKQQQF